MTSFAKNQRGFTKGKSTLGIIAKVLSIAKNIITITTIKEGTANVSFTFAKAMTRYQEISSSVN